MVSYFVIVLVLIVTIDAVMVANILQICKYLFSSPRHRVFFSNRELFGDNERHL